MTATPTISISGTSISDQGMVKGGGGIGSFTQLGQDIDGTARIDYSGEAISFHQMDQYLLSVQNRWSCPYI